MKTFLLVGLFLCAAQMYATTYYIDPDQGNDQNAGTSQYKAWRTAEPLSNIVLSAGDSVLLKSGTVLNAVVEVCGRGSATNPVLVTTYGGTENASIKAPDNALYALRIHNSDYLHVQDLNVSNHGSADMPKRTGVQVECNNYGISHDIRLKRLVVHDVNGSLVKEKGGGSGIHIVNGGKQQPSAYDGLLIEDCIIKDCHRNGMIWSAPWLRDGSDWLPNRNVVVRNCLIEGVPGDGIVPIGCDGALIEFNVMRDCPATLPTSEAAAGFWPWSCDNTVIQFNEVSDHKAPWDGQAYDSDYNCTGTVIQYNYSHDCDGGLALICNSGTSTGMGNQGTKVRYNISVNDAMRPRTTRMGVFAPSIHIAGPVKGAVIEGNIIHIGKKPAPYSHHSAITSDSWDGYADSTIFVNNIFYAEEPSTLDFSKSTNNVMRSNYLLGNFKLDDAMGDDMAFDTLNMMMEQENHKAHSAYQSLLEGQKDAKTALMPLLQQRSIANGSATLTTVNPAAIHSLIK